ncbi:hypothetical protein ACQ4M3_12960 [Leptolyngbya sp. AN03gr2]|uniref:hypothetical protein n=1 Tax=unclassified Leptolyngbya TaxID=2650499 RepID=UPI003D3230BE
MPSLINFLPEKSIDNCIEIYEKSAVLLTKNNDFPVVSIGHGACSGYVFISTSTTIEQVLIMHSSMGLFDYGNIKDNPNQIECLQAFIEQNKERSIFLLPIGRTTTAFNIFENHALGIAKRANKEIFVLDAVRFDSKAGWHFLIDVQKDVLALQIGGCEYAENSHLEVYSLEGVLAERVQALRSKKR